MTYHIRRVSTGKYYKGDIKQNDGLYEPVFGKRIKALSFSTEEAGLRRRELIVNDKQYYLEIKTIEGDRDLEVVVA